MNRKFNFDAKMAKKSLLLALSVILVTLFITIIVQSYNPNHYFSKSKTPQILIPHGSYEDFLKYEQGIPADALDLYPLNFSQLKLPKVEDMIILGSTGVASPNAINFGPVGINPETGEVNSLDIDQITGDFIENPNYITAYQTTDTGIATWETPYIAEAGLYNIYITYYPISQGGSSIERRILINEITLPIVDFDVNKRYSTQFDNLGNVKFSRYWTDRGPIVQDTTDNDMKPSQKEILNVERKAYLRDETGFIVEPYLIKLNKEYNTISFESIRESMAIVSIVITSYEAKATYANYRENLSNLGYSEVVQLDEPLRIEGQSSNERTSPTLYAIADRTSPLNYPVDPVKIKLNSIGGVKWSRPGDGITWEIDLTGKDSGLYYISFRTKQDVSRGVFSTRKVYINGELPFIEANNTQFSYSSNYQIVTLGTATEPFAFYLEGGQINTVTLEASLGDYGVPLGQVQQAINQLNNLYLRIISITTANPDPYQNYHLYGPNARVVGTLETFRDVANTLEDVSKQITQISGEKSDKVAILDAMTIQLRSMVDKPRTIQERLPALAKNISALGTWTNTIKDQPLAVEAIFVHSSLDQLPAANANFFRSSWFNIRGFVLSFVFKYNEIGTIGTVDTGKKIDVWFLTSAVAGREQANAISTLISNSFTTEYGINVNLKVVAPGVLLPSTLAGTGPDVAINVDNGSPVNYGMRNAIMDISGFREFYAVTGICSAKNVADGYCITGLDDKERRLNDPDEQYLFFDSAMVPYEYNGGYYALPNTASYLVTFYRTDIFEERGWNVPETWREVTSLVTELSLSKLQFYLPVSAAGAGIYVNPIFATMLYQRGGSFYRNDNKESNFDSEEAMLAFEEWSKYYTDYSFPLAADFLNRFRTGEMPIGIASYELFNTLSVFAPDIAGKWTFAPLPGTYIDGEFNNRGAASGSALVMMKQAKDPESAWDFMRWWVSKDVQTQYARELESILGAAARHNTANVLAFQNHSWTRAEKDVLIHQWENSVGVPEVPGGYYTGRNLENAFREVVNNRSNPRETLQKYIILINNEISKKRAEFGLDTK